MKSLPSAPLRIFALLLLAAAPLPAKTDDRAALQPAQPTSTTAPTYPYLLRRAEIPAEVTVVFTVNTRGVVTGAKIKNSSNFEFNDAALDAIKRWTFTPARKDGQPVDARLEQTFVFSVRDNSEAERKASVAASKSAR